MQRISQYQSKSTLVEGRSEVRKKDNFRAIIAIGASVVLAVSAQFAYSNIFPTGKIWNGSITVGGKAIAIQLDGTKAPKAVSNFVALAQKGFFEKTGCHRLTTDGIYVLQCGDPAGDGSGGPGYSFGPVENAPADNLYASGVLAMARTSNNGNSMGSQFFIVYKDSTIPSDTAGGYTVFGKVTENLESISEIAKLGTIDGSTDGKPKSPINLSAVTVK